jgi:hypothetical protein
MSWLGTGVCRPFGRSHPCFRARRAAHRPGSRARLRRRRVTARRPQISPPAQNRGSKPGTLTRPARPSSLAWRGRLVSRARRAAPRRRSRLCTKGMARRPARTRSCTNEHGATAGPKSLPRTAMAAPKSTGGSGASPAAVRQTCGATASNQARVHDVAPRRRGATQERETKGKKRGRGCGAHDGAMVESWPARWRGVRRRGSGSPRWSPPRPLLRVPGWSSSFLSWRDPAFPGGVDVLALCPVLGSSSDWCVAAAARPLLLPTARRGGTPAFSPNPGHTTV